MQSFPEWEAIHKQKQLKHGSCICHLIHNQDVCISRYSAEAEEWRPANQYLHSLFFKGRVESIFQGLSSISFNDFLYGLKHVYIREKYAFGVVRTVTLKLEGINYSSWLKRLPTQEQNGSNPAREGNLRIRKWHEAVAWSVGCCYRPLAPKLKLLVKEESESRLEGRWSKGPRK